MTLNNGNVNTFETKRQHDLKSRLCFQKKETVPALQKNDCADFSDVRQRGKPSRNHKYAKDQPCPPGVESKDY
jgi:hypothetical protein